MNDFFFYLIAGLDWHAFSLHWILTLAHFLWQGAAIGLLAALALSLCRRSSSQIRHGICLTALTSCLPCIIATWRLVDVDRYTLASVTPATAADSTPVTPIERIVSIEHSDGRMDLLESPAFATSPVTNETHAANSSLIENSSAANSTPLPVAVTVIDRTAPLLAMGYFLGVFLLLFRTSLGLWGGRRLRSLSQPIADSELLALIEQQTIRIGMKTVPVVAYCSRVAVPTVIGLLKPIVLLPASLVTSLNPEQLAAILSHEFAHIRRLDLFVNLLQRVMESLLFFHPVVWWLSQRISIERENCCDDLAAGSGFGNLQYAGALLRMAELSLPQRGHKFASQLIALSADGQNTPQFSRRIERLLEIPRTPRLAVSRLSAVMAVVLCVVSIGVLAQISEHDSLGQNLESEARAVSDSGEKQSNIPGSLRESKPTTEANPGLEVVQVPDVPEKGLEFLRPYPKLYSLSLDMMENQFLTIIERENLKIKKQFDGRSYSIPTDDGYTVIVMFDNNGNKCSGIQRLFGGAAKTPKSEMIADKNGIHWSSNVYDGLRVGVRLSANQVLPGEKLVVQYVLKNESKENKTVAIRSGEPLNRTLEAGNRIVLSSVIVDAEQQRQWRLQPGEVLEDIRHQSSIDTTGFPPSSYRIVANSFYWNVDPELHEKPTRVSDLELPLSIRVPEEGQVVGSAGSLLPKDIDWGSHVTGLQVGSRLQGNNNLFEPGSVPQFQLFVTNIAAAPVDVEVFFPHPHGWLTNVENREGESVSMDRTVSSRISPDQTFKIHLDAGETKPLTGVKQLMNETRSDIYNPMFRIARLPNSGYVQLGTLLSNGGVYSAQNTVILKRADMPGVKLSLNTGKTIIRVTRPESKNRETEKTRDTNEGRPNPGEEGDQPGEASLRLWKPRLVDGTTAQPLPGLIVRVNGFVTGKSEPLPIELVSTGQGIITVPLRDGTLTSVDVQTMGWWSGPYQLIGQPPSNPNQPQPEEQKLDPKSPREIKLWRGEVVKGKLLYPDKSPAAGVLLNVGVYIHNQEWKKRLGMDLGFYSWDHGEWPNWSRTILTDDDGSFTTTVPPASARSWVRVGTTTLGFGSINPERFESEGTVRALAACVPFEAEIGGNDPGFGYTIVENRAAEGSFGTLQLHAGIRIRGRVLDAEGNGLEGVFLATASSRGPHAGRSTWSGEDGRFEFLPVEPGSLIIKPDARLRDVNRMVISRDVQAVFVEREYFVPSEAVELIVQAVPHVELEFEWIDRRADKEATVSYYGHFKGHFKVVGHYPLHDDQRAYWQGETKLIERDGRNLLVVKVPRKLNNPTLVLLQDRAVTASYEDETGKTSGPGRLELGDITKPIRRTIYGDEPVKQD